MSPARAAPPQENRHQRKTRKREVPDSANANLIAKLKAATGPRVREIGERMAPSAIIETFPSTLMPDG